MLLRLTMAANSLVMPNSHAYANTGSGWAGGYYASSPWGFHECQPHHIYDCRPYSEAWND